MKKAVLILAAVVLAGALFLWLSRGSNPSQPQVAVQFLCFTNDQKLGASAFVRITNSAGYPISFPISGVFSETKTNGSWMASTAPVQWKSAGRFEAFGRNDIGFISLGSHLDFVVVVPLPLPRAAWRVRLDYEDGGFVAALLGRVTRGRSGRFLGLFLVHKSISVVSPEIRD
jgi:hypothetical protein